MSNQYIYSGEQALVIQDGTLLWNDQSQNHPTLQILDANDTIINDSPNDDSYVTAIDSNETQYFSILEHSDSGEISLEDLHNLTIQNADDVSNMCLDENVLSDIPSLDTNEDNDDSEVIVFTMDGSDDLYGIQVTCDEDGNIQKYQFKFRKTSDGQLEPIPESVILLSNDNDVNSEAGSIEADIVKLSEPQDELFLTESSLDSKCSSVPVSNITQAKPEGKFVKDNYEELGQNDEEHIEHSISDNLEHFQIKTEIVERTQSFRSSLAEKVKQEYQDQEMGFETSVYDENFHNEVVDEGELMDTHEQQQQDSYVDDMSEMPVFQEEEQQPVELNTSDNQQINDVVQHFMSDNIEVLYETELEVPETSLEESQFKDGFSGPNNNSVEYAQSNLGSIIDENGSFKSSNVKLQLDENYTGSYQSGNAIKEPENISEKEEKRKSASHLNYYLIYSEKENVNSLIVNSQLPVPKLTRVNPRSVLRTSFVRPKEKSYPHQANTNQDCDLFHKRFAKNKDAMRAKHFHNFLNRTTIPHAPVRQQRQPRKQKIKPVIERRDEEIIVQEVIISASGLIESFNKKMKNKKVQVTEVVELSDSDDDSNKTTKIDRRKSRHLLRHTSESEANIIEIRSDNEEWNSQKHEVNANKVVTTSGVPETFKRRRGRPPKNRKRSLEPIKEKKESIIVVSEGDNSLLCAVGPDKKELTCPYCPKTFPSQNSLNTHIYHHNLENSLKNKAALGDKKQAVTRHFFSRKFEYSHKCNDCQTSFKNAILLGRHNCSMKETTLMCPLCLKQFRDITLFNIHKKSHVKSNLIRNTSITKVTPKKIPPRRSVFTKSPVKQFKCSECPKVCDSMDKLTVHSKTHRKFICPSCFSVFSSKILFDAHIQFKCVKTKCANLSCDRCGERFPTLGHVTAHKVQKHGLIMPCKSPVRKPRRSSYKSRSAHGGVPSNDRLKTAYVTLQQKITESGVLSSQ